MMTATNRRAALTLIEVLMTILVLAIGLLGVAALLPLGQQQMKRGIINQRTAELGDKALEAVETFGLTNPARWVAYDTTAAGYYHYDAVTSNNTRIACPVTSATTTTITTDGSLGTIAADQYDDCFVEIIRSDTLLGLRRRADWDSGTTTFTLLASALPTAPGSNDVFFVKRSQAIAIDPYYFATHPPIVADFAPGVPRLTLTASDRYLANFPMDLPTATSLFVSSDDLIFNKSDDYDVLPTQAFYGEQFNDGDGSGTFDGANEIALIEDDFSASTLGGGQYNRIRTRHAVAPGEPGDWREKGGGAWILSGGTLQNPSATNENGVAMVVDVTSITDTSTTQLDVSFDYTLGDTNEQLFFHIWGVDDTTDGAGLLETNSYGSTGTSNDGIAHVNRTNGTMPDMTWQTGSPDVLATYNLLTGSGSVGYPAQAIELTGTTGDSFSTTIDMSGYALNNITEYDYIMVGFARNVAGASSAVTIDNVNLTATAANNPSGDTFNPATHDLNGDGLYTAELKRQSERSYSWLATLVPAEGGADTRYYTVSAAVFYKRPVRVPVDLTQAGSPQTTLNLTFLAGLNYGGGRATISTSDANFFAAIFEDVDSSGDFEPAVDRVQIKANQWVLVTAPPGGGSPPAVCRWYRIGSVGQPDVVAGTCSVDVRLVGADWNTAALGTTANVTFYEGLKGVFQRTMPIETLPIGNVAP